MTESFPRGDGRPVRLAFDWQLVLGDVALVLWLWRSCMVFLPEGLPWWPGAPLLALAASAGSWRLGGHSPGGKSHLRLARQAGLLALIVGGLLFLAYAWHGPQENPWFCLWFGVAAAALIVVFHVSWWACRASGRADRWEIFRWLAVGGAAVALLWPFYGRHSLGSGDAYWYVVMLADFTAQMRQGVFPVWIGQSLYAFNGAVSPLRLAPWFQYCGGLLDLLTAHRLEPTALKNAEICASGLVTAASAFFCLRAALPRSPVLAWWLALLWLACPAVLATACVGDQYLEFMALPFVPLLLLGCWRLWARDDGAARICIVVALAGMMLSHTPTALWGGFLAAGMYVGHMAARRSWRREGPRVAAMAASFLILGGFPVGSTLTIANPALLQANGRKVPEVIAGLFPDNFKPITGVHLSLASYQLGYTLLAVGALALVLLAWRRPPGALAFALAIIAVVPLTLPVPFLTAWIWVHMPTLVTSITNVWPTQRLFEYWAIIIVFSLVLVLAAAAVPRGRRFLLGTALAAGGLWSAQQAGQMVAGFSGTAVDAATANVYLRPENLVLARYSYYTFATTPAYFSHAHLDPLLENRLLDRQTRRVMTANADAAAPKLQGDAGPGDIPRLVQSGVWNATSDNHSRFYKLTPLLHLEPGVAYALRLDGLPSERKGVLQITAPNLFREYLLPDSGEGMSSLPLGFGALASSSHVATLQQAGPGAEEPASQFVADVRQGEQFDFARYWLYSYRASDLPIRVTTWIPYRAETEVAIPAYLETPRVWERGWRAEVNGREVTALESPQHLTMIPIEPGPSRVKLTFHAPLWLSGWFWISLLGWLVLLIACARRAFARAQSGFPLQAG